MVLGETEVTGLEVTRPPFGRPRIRAVATARGTIAVEQVVIACGVWSPRLAAMAGAAIPLTPAVHQMADLGPIDLLHRTGNEIAYPIVRDMDVFMYERQSHDAMEVGSYAHRPILVHPDDIPSLAAAERSPTELPFTAGDFAPQLEQAREIMGGLLAGSEMRYSVNGLLSLTPDTHQVLGETAEVEKAVVGGGGLGQGGPGHGAPDRGVDHARLPAPVRPARIGRHALLSARADRGAHPPAVPRALQQDLRHRSPARAVGVGARPEPGAVPRPDRRPRRRVLRGARLGTAPVVRVERRPGRAPRGRGPSARVGPPLVVADHRRRASPPAREGGRGRPERVPDLRRVGARRRALPGAADRQPAAIARSAAASTRRC